MLLASSITRRSLDRKRPLLIEPDRFDWKLRTDPADESLPGGAERADRDIETFRRSLLRSLRG